MIGARACRLFRKVRTVIYQLNGKLELLPSPCATA